MRSSSLWAEFLKTFRLRNDLWSSSGEINHLVIEILWWIQLTGIASWLIHLQISGNIRELNQAWDLYYHVFRRITRQLPQLTSLELQYVSPNLQVCQDLELAVPGSYAPGQPIVRIASFHESLEVSFLIQICLCKLCFDGKNHITLALMMKLKIFYLSGFKSLRIAGH